MGAAQPDPEQRVGEVSGGLMERWSAIKAGVEFAGALLGRRKGRSFGVCFRCVCNVRQAIWPWWRQPPECLNRAHLMRSTSDLFYHKCARIVQTVSIKPA